MIEYYSNEKDGQIDFYNRFLPRINPQIEISDVTSDYNDGILNGNLLEFKKNVINLDEHLFQCIKYLSSLRVKGRPIPANINIIDLNDSIAYCFSSELYIEKIEQVYYGGASKNNKGFIGGKPDRIFYYDKSDVDAENFISILKENNFTKIHIDENCIVGWATEFYRITPNARKEDFIGDETGKHKVIGEIRNPRIFANYIYPYTGETNIKFKYLMDKLNDTLMKKNTGAFYTDSIYAKKSLELVRKAINRVPVGNDYIILDRCAGTGNLEALLSDDELSHCIVSTVEYYEYKVLQELIGSKVRRMIPPKENQDTFNAGFVNGADALSLDYINNSIIKEYIDNPKCTIILFENPPYVETMSIEWQKNKNSKKSSLWKNSYVVQEMKKDVKGVAKGQVTNDMGNAFIWSAFKYYLRQPTDSYIVFSPVKYWKAQHLISKQFIDGFAFNRKFFHTNTNACIMCALWANIDTDINEIELDAFDIKNNFLLPLNRKLPVKRIYSVFSNRYYDKSIFNNASSDGILVSLNGIEPENNVKRRITPLYSEEILGYLVADSSGFENPDTHSSLLVAGRYNGNGFYLRKENYLEKLPMFAASRYITYNKDWTERARIMKSADGADKYFKDLKDGKLTQFLLKCLLFSCLETQNHMRSFRGSDGRFYKNELCLDNTNGETIAYNDLKKLCINKIEKLLLTQWDIALSYAKQTKNYNPQLTYGIYQIFIELNTFHKDKNSKKRIYDYKELDTVLKRLKLLLKEYYNSEIVPVLFEYEFLK